MDRKSHAPLGSWTGGRRWARADPGPAPCAPGPGHPDDGPSHWREPASPPGGRGGQIQAPS